MRAAVWRGKRDLRIETVAEPQLINPHDAIVRVTASSICGSDLHAYHGAPGVRPGDILGHEVVGELVALGRACERLTVGDRVAVMCGIACGRCWFCRHELYALCDNAAPAGSPVERTHGHPGGALHVAAQAEYVRIPFADIGCVTLPPEVSDAQALLLTDALPTAYMAAESCRIQPGDTIAVLGAGPIGLLAIRSALVLGADRVIAVDRIKERLALAAEHGAVVVDELHGDVVDRLIEITGGRGPDAVIDATGTGAQLSLAIAACRKGGVIALPAMHGGTIDRFPIGAVFAKGLHVELGQTHFQRYVRPLLARLLGRELDPAFVISDRVALADLPAAYARFDTAPSCIKVMATP